jgi:hypothetical protein
MICPGDNILPIGWKLKTAISIVTTQDVIIIDLDSSARGGSPATGQVDAENFPEAIIKTGRLQNDS